MGQSVVMMAPTTSACAARTSTVLAAVSSMRIWGLRYRVIPVPEICRSLLAHAINVRNNLACT